MKILRKQPRSCGKKPVHFISLTNSFIILYANVFFVIINVVLFFVFSFSIPLPPFLLDVPFSKYLTGAKLKKGLNLNSNGNFAFRQGQNDIEDGVHAKANGGYDGHYADAGPPSANGTNRFVQPQLEQQQQQQAAVSPPDYAVVDKSKKKNKDTNNGNENIPDYTVVDKSKKKKNKKAETEDPYAEVEDPKKVGKRSQASRFSFETEHQS